VGRAARLKRRNRAAAVRVHCPAHLPPHAAGARHVIISNQPASPSDCPVILSERSESKDLRLLLAVSECRVPLVPRLRGPGIPPPMSGADARCPIHVAASSRNGWESTNPSLARRRPRTPSDARSVCPTAGGRVPLVPRIWGPGKPQKLMRAKSERLPHRRWLGAPGPSHLGTRETTKAYASEERASAPPQVVTRAGPARSPRSAAPATPAAPGAWDDACTHRVPPCP